MLTLFPPINRWAILTCPSGTLDRTSVIDSRFWSSDRVSRSLTSNYTPGHTDSFSLRSFARPFDFVGMQFESYQGVTFAPKLARTVLPPSSEPSVVHTILPRQSGSEWPRISTLTVKVSAP